LLGYGGGVAFIGGLLRWGGWLLYHQQFIVNVKHWRTSGNWAWIELRKHKQMVNHAGWLWT